jgi:hypothetical protein
MKRVLSALVVALVLDVAIAAAEPVLSLPPEELARRMAHDDFTVDSSKEAGGGVMGARHLVLRFDDGSTMDVKWKATSAQCDGWNNSPRREIGAYVAQETFLDPADYLVPPAAVRCIPLEAYAPIDENATPTRKGITCVFGLLSAWLQNVEQPDKAYDPERFATDPAYAYNFANLNLLHYLIAHRDSRANNFLTPKDRADRRIFSVDNGIAFGDALYNFFTWHFDEIRVQGLPKKSIERLRRLQPADVERWGVLAQLEADPAGVWRPVPLGNNLDPEAGVRFYDRGIQLGLTREEIDGVLDRLRTLMSRIDAHEIALF